MGSLYHQVCIRLHSSRWLPGLALSGPILLFLSVYGPSAGHGFVRDDYAWMLHSQLNGWDDLLRVLGSDIGFYRPVVSLTFGFNGWFFGSNSLGYGLTNVLLALGCGWAIASLARALGLPRGAAVLAGALWLVHPDFLPVSVLWISGRTALLMILGATASAAALMRGRLWLSLAWLVVALFSKEEAVLVGFVLFAWLLILSSPPVRPLRWALSAGAVEAMYFLARGLAGATNPLNAPPFYRFTFDPATVAGNLAWYLLHAGGLALVVVVIAWLTLRITLAGRLPILRPSQLLLFSLIWILAGLGLTIWLPVRSHLYLALPAVGACLAAAALCAEWWAAASPPRRPLAVGAAIALVVALVPAHLRGAREWTARTDFAATVLGDLGALTAGLPDGSRVVLGDDRNDPRGNLASVFGTMASEASVVASGRPLLVWIEPPPPHAEVMGLRPPCQDCAAIRLNLVAGRLRPGPSSRSHFLEEQDLHGSRDIRLNSGKWIATGK
ncbi:MAG TPA: hypothetical protein VES67_01940 [Vicinamibacterales bacterium]|nr:hypothetical protein [Vicinamibacterales bacterium]